MSFVASIDALRLVLFGGLLAHKLLWEVLKRRSPTERRQQVERGLGSRLIKLAKVVALGGLVAQTLFLDVLPITEQATTLRILGTLIFFVGLGTAVLGRVQLGQNWKDVEDLAVARHDSLATHGIYSYIRHPIYAGDMLLLIGVELALNSWLVLAMVIPIIVFARQANAEETVLARIFQDYATYRTRTKRFIPFLI